MLPNLAPAERDILRRLAADQAEIALLPVHQEKAELWRRLNDLQPVRPMVWINEIPWNEMNVDHELTLRCQDEWARQQEWELRTRLYQWRHMPADMIFDAYLPCPLVVHSTGFGVAPLEEIIRSDATSDVVSHHYLPQFHTLEDVEKIKDPLITYDEPTTTDFYDWMCDLYAGILPVRKLGFKGVWFSPWDRLVEWWGVERALTDLLDRPELVQAAITRLVEAHLCLLDQWEALNLLTRNDDNTRIGSGGYGYTTALPGKPYDPAYPRPHNLWGCATAQILGSVSPKMHWEFALQHELKWLQRWGLTYYGCCEPLDIKMGILRRIPNLRKVSMSPWVNVPRAVSELEDKYVFSRKPSPAVLAEDTWNPAKARFDLVDFLEQARGCRVELILKDISTVRYQPQRLWEWEKLAMQAAEQFAP
jgi:hypothetical protein